MGGTPSNFYRRVDVTPETAGAGAISFANGTFSIRDAGPAARYSRLRDAGHPGPARAARAGERRLHDPDRHGPVLPAPDVGALPGLEFLIDVEEVPDLVGQVARHVGQVLQPGVPRVASG